MRYSSRCCTVHAELPGVFLTVPFGLGEAVPHQRKLTQWNLPQQKWMRIGATMAEGVANSPKPS